jgi:hypothetical protein
VRWLTFDHLHITDPLPEHVHQDTDNDEEYTRTSPDVYVYPRVGLDDDWQQTENWSMSKKKHIYTTINRDNQATWIKNITKIE